MDYEALSKTMKALADPQRLKIIDILSCGERCACEVLPHFSFTQPTLSHHMGVLMECGLVNVRKEGTWSYYTLNEEKWKVMSEILAEIATDHQDCICFKQSNEKNDNDGGCDNEE